MIRSPCHTPAAALLLSLAACGNADIRTSLSAPAIDTLSGGVIQVTNTGPSLWVGDSGWRFTEGVTIAPPEGSPGELSEVSGMTMDPAGNVYVLQTRPTVIKVFGPDGAWIRDIGREGDGPGEFRDGMLGLIGDTLLIQDPNNTRLTTFRTDGTFLASHPSQCCYFMSGGLTAFADGTVAIAGPPPGASTQSGAWYMTHADGTVSDTVFMPARDDDPAGSWTVRRSSGNSTSMMMTSVPGHPQDVQEWRRDGVMVRGNTATYTLVLGRTYGDTSRIVISSAPQLTLTDTQRDSLYDDAMANTNEQWRDALKEVAKRSDIPGTRPMFSAIAVDDANRIWVGLPGPTSDVEMLEVFSPDGVLLGRVPAPDPKILQGTFVGDRVVLQDESELGLPRIRTFTLTRSVRD
ncbi:MAG: hypothetical protein ABI542_03890 [Gemmatimonadota bacterium]